MQLLIKRGQREGIFGQPTFDLWAQFDPTSTVPPPKSLILLVSCNHIEICGAN